MHKNFWILFCFFVDNINIGIDNGVMITTNVKKTDYEKSWISSVKFSKDEKAMIKKARIKLHVDMPSLYHDCIMASVMQIVAQPTRIVGENHGA